MARNGFWMEGTIGFASGSRLESRNKFCQFRCVVRLSERHPEVASNTPKSWTMLDAGFHASNIRRGHIQRPTTQRAFLDIFVCFLVGFWSGLGLGLV